MLDEGSKNDAETYLRQYPKDRLDDEKKDKNWAFYDDRITNMGDREMAKISDMHAWYGDHEKLERYHDYIQWLFPLHDPSMFNQKIQLLQRHEVRKIRRSKTASARFRKSYEMMLDFFGMQLVDETSGEVRRKTIDKNAPLPAGWKKRSSMVSGKTYYEKETRDRIVKKRHRPGSALDRLDELNSPGNHNFRRISRILKSMGEMGFAHWQYPLLVNFAREIYQHKTLEHAEKSFRLYWKVFLIDQARRRELETLIRELQEKDKGNEISTSPPSSSSKDDDDDDGALVATPRFRTIVQPALHNNDEENETDNARRLVIGHDIVLFVHGIQSTGRNWVGLYKTDQLDETVGNRAVPVPPVPGTDAYRRAMELKADMGYPPRVRQALALQRRHIAHFVPQIQAGRQIRTSQVRPCKYGTHNGMSAVVVTHPNEDTTIAPGDTYTIRWSVAPYATLVYGGDDEIEIILQRRGPDVRVATYVTKACDLLKGSFTWNVPKTTVEGSYFISLRRLRFQRGDVEHVSPTRGGFTIKAVKSDESNDLPPTLPPAIALIARKSSERSSESGNDDEDAGNDSKAMGVEGSLRIKAACGPWEPGTYEFRYFDSGWDAESDSLLFVPARGPVATSSTFVVPSDPVGPKRPLKPLPSASPPDPKELASYAWTMKESAHAEELERRKRRDEIVGFERTLGLYRDISRVKAMYKGKWYAGEFVKSKFTESGEQKFGVQCDADRRGTLTWVTKKKLKIVDSNPRYDNGGAWTVG